MGVGIFGRKLGDRGGGKKMGLGIWFQEETYCPELMHGFARETSRMKLVVSCTYYVDLTLNSSLFLGYKREPWIPRGNPGYLEGTLDT